MQNSIIVESHKQFLAKMKLVTVFKIRFHQNKSVKIIEYQIKTLHRFGDSQRHDAVNNMPHHALLCLHNTTDLWSNLCNLAFFSRILNSYRLKIFCNENTIWFYDIFFKVYLRSALKIIDPPTYKEKYFKFLH